MIWRKPLVTLIVFALLVLAYVGDRYWIEQRRTAKEHRERAFPIEQPDVVEMTLVTPDEIITCKKSADDRWVMTQPLQTRADKDAIEVILGNLVPALRYGEFPVDATIKIEDYGLDAPKYKLTLKTKDAREFTLLIGAQTAQSGKFYAKIDADNKIFSINEYIKDKLDKKPFDLRDRSILDLDVDNVRQFTLTRVIEMPIEIKSKDDKGTTQTTTAWQRKPPEEIVVAKKDGKWQIQKPTEWTGDTNEIENLLRKVDTQKAASFIDEPTSETFGLDTPQVELKVEQLVKAGDAGTTGTSQTETLALVVGDRATSPTKGYYARRHDGKVITVEREMLDALAIRATLLRDKQMFSLTANDVAHFEIEAGKSKVVLNKNGQGRWVLADDEATSVDQQVVQDKIASLVGLRARDFETDAPENLAEYRLDKPHVRLTVADAKREKVEGIDMGDLATRNNESVVFARPRQSKSVVLLDFTRPSEFALTKDNLIDKSLYVFEIEDVARAEVTREGTSFTLARQDDAWMVRKPGDEKPRRVASFWADDLVRGVRDLKYKDIYKGKLTERDMGLTSPTIQVVLFGQDDVEIARLTRGMERGQRFYTRTKPDGPVYGVDASGFRTLESAVTNLLK